jgi:hypothetical protein
MQELLLDRCGEFMADLRAGRLPPPDESESSYSAWSAMAQFAKGETQLLAEPEAIDRARMWRQARADAKAAAAIEDSQRLWFATRAPDGAERIELLDGTVLSRTATNRKGYTVAPGRTVSWRFEKDAG